MITGMTLPPAKPALPPDAPQEPRPQGPQDESPQVDVLLEEHGGASMYFAKTLHFSHQTQDDWWHQ